jgi:GDPmannose 4,6-dehydratase
MLQASCADTFVLATGRTASVREFATLAFAAAGIAIEWRGDGVDETGIDAANGAVRVRINPAFHRPAEVDRLAGDAAKAQRELGWSATVPLEDLCRAMVEADIARVARGASA